MYIGRFVVFFVWIICSYNAKAFYNDIQYTPASIQGYTTYGYASRIGQTEDMPSYSAYENENTTEVISKRNTNIEKIQTRYKVEGVENLTDEVQMPITNTSVVDGVKGYKRSNISHANPQQITSTIFEKICSDIGFNKNTERNALAFHECVSEGMKTKLTEETNDKTVYNEIDTNIVQSLSANTLLDKSIEDFIPYQEMVTQRNKMDCLKKANYYQCINAITSYKQCYNEIIDYTVIEHQKNQIVCYTKTAIKFPNPNTKEEYIRDAYFGMCIHLIEKDLKKTFITENAQCNKILTKGNLLGIAI